MLSLDFRILVGVGGFHLLDWKWCVLAGVPGRDHGRLGLGWLRLFAGFEGLAFLFSGCIWFSGGCGYDNLGLYGRSSI